MKHMLRTGATMVGVAAVTTAMGISALGVVAGSSAAAGSGPAAVSSGGAVAATPRAAAATSGGAVPFSQAKFSGYASGSELHLAALDFLNTQVADVEQAPTGAAVNSAGLTSAIKDPTTNYVVSPSGLPSGTAAYGTGTGIEVGLGTSTTATTDPNQIKQGAQAQQMAPPNSAPVTASAGSTASLTAAGVPAGLISASALQSEASAIYNPNVCPLGEPLSEGAANAANVSLLNLSSLGLPATPPLTLTGPLLETSGSNNTTSVAETTSQTFLAANPDGVTYGLTSEEGEIIAPLTANLLGLATLQVAVQGTSPNQPITLAANAPGGSSGASVKLTNDGVVNVTLTVAGTTTTLASLKLSDIAKILGRQPQYPAFGRLADHAARPGWRPWPPSPGWAPCSAA